MEVVEVRGKGYGVHVVCRVDLAIDLYLLRVRRLLRKHQRRQQGDEKGAHHAPHRVGDRIGYEQQEFPVLDAARQVYSLRGSSAERRDRVYRCAPYLRKSHSLHLVDHFS